MAFEGSVAPRSHRNLASSSSSRYICPLQPCFFMAAGQGGDDVSDDYIPDELVATSCNEEEYSHHGSSHGYLSLDDDTSKPSGSIAHAGSEKSNKRKRSGKDKQKRLKVSHLNQTSELSGTEHE